LNTQSIVPQHFFEPLSITEANISSQNICQLSQQFNQWLRESFHQENTSDLLHARAEFVDHILRKLWSQHHLDEYQISLVAVGGYGRGELHPYSDIDILLLTPEEISTELEENISAFITQLWDVKLDIGSSVRSVQECIAQATKDITIATNLLEMRLISGTETLTQQLLPLLDQHSFWSSKDFFIAKREEQAKRHQQYHGAAYTLEPNLKANPGGLRDIQTIAWVAKRHFAADSLEELVDHNYLTHDEFFELLECQDYLWRMRFALHFVANRNENRLLFDYQAEVAHIMGFGDEGKVVIERMMKRFFRTIARVAELNKMLLQYFEHYILQPKKQHNIPVIIDKDFSINHGLIEINNDRLFMRPVKIMAMFLMIAKYDEIVGIQAQTIRLMRNARRRLIFGLVDYAQCRRIFLDIIKQPKGLGLAFTLMHEHNILAAYLPAWRNITGQMQFDLFHAYSVDEHSYRLIKNLYRFSQSEYNNEFPLCSKIVQRIRKPEVLFLAGIFHDIAKGRGGDHAKLGAIDALDFCKSHQINTHDAKMVAWLVEHHLLMSITAQRKDINNEEVINAFGSIVRDEAHLDYLYCLTVADMRATNESLWNSWKANLLEELYFNTKRAFRRGLEKPVDMRAKIRENQQQALAILQERGVNQTQVEQLWAEHKADYFLRYSPEQIAWHSENILKHDRSKPLVLISPKPYRGGTEIFIYTKEKASIFAATVALLDTKKLSILDAKIITSKTGYTLNTFVVLDNHGEPLHDSYRIQAVINALTSQLQNNTLTNKKQKLLKPNKRHVDTFKFKPQISFVKSPAKNKTNIEIVALDHPGLLAQIGQVFQHCNIYIYSAKITTFGEKAEDVFTISNNNNQALSPQEQQQLTDELITALT
jgi:[protein-PII] uridylyltransferase